MAKLIELTSFKDERGSLTVIEKVLPFEIKRVFYIYNVVSPRGGHGHKVCKMALISLNGEVDVKVKKKQEVLDFKLKSPDQALLLEPDDWHEMYNFTNGCTLLVLCSHEYNKEDYLYEPV